MVDKTELTVTDEKDWTGRGHALDKPCAACPFSRSIGTDLKSRGNPDPSVYVGQAYGPFWLPCHRAAGFTEDGRCNVAADIPQCAGAAAFRANVGVADLLPPAMLRLPPDHVNVFSDGAELIAHHLQIPLEEARLFLKNHPPEKLMRWQLAVARGEPRAKVWAVRSGEGGGGS